MNENKYYEPTEEEYWDMEINSIAMETYLDKLQEQENVQ